MRNIPTQKKNRKKKTSRIQQKRTEENEKEKGKSCYPSPSPNIYHPLGFTPLFVGCFSILHTFAQQFFNGKTHSGGALTFQRLLFRTSRPKRLRRPLADKTRTIPTLFFSVLSPSSAQPFFPPARATLLVYLPPLSLSLCVCVSRRLFYIVHNFDIFTCKQKICAARKRLKLTYEIRVEFRQRHHVFLALFTVCVCVGLVCVCVCGADPDRKKERKYTYTHTSTVWWRV